MVISVLVDGEGAVNSAFLAGKEDSGLDRLVSEEGGELVQGTGYPNGPCGAIGQSDRSRLATLS